MVNVRLTASYRRVARGCILLAAPCNWMCWGNMQINNENRLRKNPKKPRGLWELMEAHPVLEKFVYYVGALAAFGGVVLSAAAYDGFDHIEVKAAHGGKAAPFIMLFGILEQTTAYDLAVVAFWAVVSAAGSVALFLGFMVLLVVLVQQLWPE